MKTLNRLLLLLVLTFSPFLSVAATDTTAKESATAPGHGTVTQLLPATSGEDVVSRERFQGTVIALSIIIVAFLLMIYYRHQGAMRLESAYRELEEANARAEESSRMKTNFIRQISHEIRTPLNLLCGFTQVITSDELDIDNNTRKHLKKQITENTGRITDMINKMLELSEANSQIIIDRNEEVSAVQIAAEAADISGVSTAQHLILDLELSSEAEKAILRTNKTAAVRALSFVLDNARKFTAPSRPDENCSSEELVKKRVTLRVEAEGSRIIFTVEDTGIGIPAEKAEHIFEEFVQLDDYYDGTGLGLAVGRTLARRLGGDLQFDSTYTQGARFHFTLPC
ncbi:MAG: HAMP domain-containing histidine kinase [Bacteroidales bacterium]|nr:HAMP domain-containing histidine kinase [Bacteroidales bacterium]